MCEIIIMLVKHASVDFCSPLVAAPCGLPSSLVHAIKKEEEEIYAKDTIACIPNSM